MAKCKKCRTNEATECQGRYCEACIDHAMTSPLARLEPSEESSSTDKLEPDTGPLAGRNWLD
jgi:hypothetical protein